MSIKNNELGKSTLNQAFQGDWEVKKLGKIINLVSGQDLTTKEYNSEGQGIPYITGASNIKNETVIINRWTDKPKSIAKKGDLLITCKGTVGTMAILNEEKVHIARQIMAIQNENTTTILYIKLFLETYIQKLKASANGLIPGISRNTILSIQIPLPPLETQKAIVARLDQIFTELDQTKSEIQKNLDNTDELGKSALNQAFQGDWEMKKIEDIADIKSGKRLPKGNFVQDKKTDYPYIRVSDFGDDGTITVSTVKYITEEIHEQIKKYIITDKDLYVSIAGTIGKTGIIPSELNGANLTENAVRLVYNGKYKIDNRFILYFTNSKSFEVQAGLASRAVAMPKLAISRLENIELPVPPLSEQEKIVEHLDQVSKEVKALKSQYQSQLDNLEELKKSVLDKAFRGEIG